jgi:hypothetical protein
MLFWHLMQRHHGAELAESTGCTPKKITDSTDGTYHAHSDEHFLGSDKAFLILSFPGMSPLLQLPQMLSECKCAHGFC